MIDKIIENNKTVWLCKCDCGNYTKVSGGNLRGNRVNSCGCIKSKLMQNKMTTHGLSNHKLFKVHEEMLRRCYNSNHKEFHRYGGRGITVCEEWKDFLTFYNWAIQNGYQDGLTIERINNNGNYCPENCIWSDRLTQANNTVNTRYIEYQNKFYTITKLSKLLGIKRGTICSRINRNIPIGTPVRKREK